MNFTNLKDLFYRHLAQTSPEPMEIEIEKAEGIYLYSPDGKRYMDLISGISVSNIGHCHPEVVRAVQEQVAKYMHVMVYGELVQSPQVLLAKRLTELLPAQLDCVYLVNSGSEAIEGAIKLARRFTGRSEILSCYNAYHGCTNGAMSIMGSENFTRAFRPLLPDCNKIRFGEMADIEKITTTTAAVITEVVQGEAGVRYADKTYWQQLRNRCNETQTLLVFDEIQTGFGRTGSLFAFEQVGVVPDMLTLAKGMGGGMPIGAFIASQEIMNCLTHNPVLGHITTFGGHPVSCAAALASLEVIEREKLYLQVPQKAGLFNNLLSQLPNIKKIRQQGLLMALEFENQKYLFETINRCREKGVLTDWFLFCDTAMRLAPPLVIGEEEIVQGCAVIAESVG